MSPSRKELLDLVEETYGVRHPDFDSIREEYKRVRDGAYDETVKSDARILLVGLQVIRNTYYDWTEMSDYEKEQSIGAVEIANNMTKSTLKKYNINV